MKKNIKLMLTALTISMVGLGLNSVAYAGAEKTPLKLAAVDSEMINPEVSFKEYSKFKFEPLDFSGMEVVNPELRTGRESKWRVTGRDRKNFEKKYQKAVAEVFDKDGVLKLTENKGSGVLVVKSKIVKFVPTTPKHNSPDKIVGTTFKSGLSAIMTIETQLIDGATNKVLANFTEERDMGDAEKIAKITRSQFDKDLEYGFEHWASNFKNNFEDVLAAK